MSARRKKPPIDATKVGARLTHAQEHVLLVRVRRWIPGADRLDGFVVGVGADWVALQRLSDRITFDGWTLVRLEDIQAVAIDPDPDTFEIQALRRRSLWPPTAPKVALEDPVAVLRAVAAASPMVAVHAEFERADTCRIGAIQHVDSTELRLLTVSVSARWAGEPDVLDPQDVTRLDFGGGYEEALLLVAGAPPTTTG